MFNDDIQTETHTAETFVAEPSVFEVELAIEELKHHKSSGIDQIPSELIKAGEEQFAIRFINLLFLFAIRRNCLRSGSSRSSYQSIGRAIKQTAVIIGAYHFCILHTTFYPTSCCPR